MEDQGVQIPQTFSVKNFPSFNRHENMTIGVLSSEFWIQIMDLKQLPGL